MTSVAATSTGRGGGEPLGRPLLFSAVAHLLVLSAWCLIGGVAVPFSPVRVVQVLLVDAKEGADVPASASGPTKARTRRPSPPPQGTAANRDPGSAKEAESPGITAVSPRMGFPVAPTAMPPDTAPVAEVTPPTPASPSPSADAVHTVSSMVEHSRVPPRPGRVEAAERPATDGQVPRVPTDVREGSGATDGAGPAGSTSGAARGVVSRSPANPGASGESTLSSASAGGGDGSGGGSRGTAAEEGAIGRLREKIQSRIVYPEEAIRRGQEGEVVLRIRVGEDGSAREVRVARSSGARILDDAARTGVVRAAPLPSSPGWFEVPVRFRLQRSL